MKNLITKIVFSIVFVAVSTLPIQAKGVTPPTPYEHIPVDTFIAGFPSEALIMLGLIAYIVGTIYIFNSALLRQTIK